MFGKRQKKWFSVINNSKSIFLMSLDCVDRQCLFKLNASVRYFWFWNSIGKSETVWKATYTQQQQHLFCHPRFNWIWLITLVTVSRCLISVTTQHHLTHSKGLVSVIIWKPSVKSTATEWRFSWLHIGIIISIWKFYEGAHTSSIFEIHWNEFKQSKRNQHNPFTWHSYAIIRY